MLSTVDFTSAIKLTKNFIEESITDIAVLIDSNLDSSFTILTNSFFWS